MARITSSERGEEEIIKNILANNSGLCGTCKHYINDQICERLQVYEKDGVIKLEARDHKQAGYTKGNPFSPFKQFSCPMWSNRAWTR